ncbi:MAG: tetratricopeptide repeat protein [Bacteroidetes bacterium]|nr:tetratricopeptide repeat protein [Bacteroidota bacterium]
MICRKNILILIGFICTVFISCKNSLEDNELQKLNLKADSLSIKLNSPQLKDVNAQLLKEPNNASLYNKRARVYLGLKQFPEAVGDALRAIKLDSTQALHYNTLVDVYFAQNKTRQAKDLLEIMEKKFPENTEALLKLGELFYLVKQYQKGIEYVNKALKINENLAKAYYLKGSIYRESGDTARAISSLQTAVEQDSKFEDAFYDLGIIFAARKNPLALEYYDNILRINSAHENARYARARLLQDLNKTEDAIAGYESILAKNKNCENCLYNLGAIYLEIKKDNKKALEYFTKAVEANPNYLEAYFARGYTYSALKDKTSAEADYKMCLKLQANYEPAIQGLRELK